MKIDISTIRDNYEKMHDSEIKQIALYEVKELRPEIIDILKNEIQKRDSLRYLEEFIDIQAEGINHVDMKPIIKKMRSLRCPTCSDASTPLNAAATCTTFGCLIFCYTSRKFQFGCPRCLIASAKEASLLTTLFGWWFFPWSIFWSISSLRQNSKYFSLKHQNELTDDFISFVERNFYRLKDASNKDESLQYIINNVSIPK